MFALTQEQREAVAMAKKMQSFKVSALAGTGKTTTLAAIAQELGQKRGLYLSFNKAIATEAQRKFEGSACQARTFHSLAFAGFGRKYGARLNKRLNASYLRSRFGVTGDYSYAIGEVALGTLSRFLRTSDAQITKEHVAWNDACKAIFAERRELEAIFASCGENPSLKTEINQKLAENEQNCKTCYKIRDQAIELAKRALGEMLNPKSDFPVTHDLYLREFVLSSPKLNAAGFRYDYILFDEAQDADGLMLLLTTAQKIPVFYVGDAFQQIYEWRGAKNAMQSLDLPETPLTMSFRFGQAVADDANQVLQSLGAKYFLEGRPDRTSKVFTGKSTEASRATIVRTNAEAIDRAMSGLSDKQRVGVSGKAGIRAFLRDYQKLVDGEPSGQFALFKSEDELREHAGSSEGNDIKMLLKLVDDYGVDGLQSVMDSSVDLDGDKDAWKSCDRIVITAHKSKGMEFDSVCLSDGLFNKKRLESDEEKRLLYVAKTRAIHTLRQPTDYAGLRV